MSCKREKERERKKKKKKKAVCYVVQNRGTKKTHKIKISYRLITGIETGYWQLELVLVKTEQPDTLITIAVCRK
jgi:hypothetical protein